MAKIDEWVKRVRIMGKGKPLEQVRAFDRNVVMTTTQAWRFRELQAGNPPPQPALQDRKWYSLQDACDRLGCSEDDLLADVSEGRVACYVEASRLRGAWKPGRAAPAATPAHLALPVEHCRQIAAYGSANVRELEYRRQTPPTVFRLAETQWIDRKALRFAHPLPDRSGTES